MPGDVEPGGLAVEVEERADHPPGVGGVAEEHQRPDGVAALGLVQVVVGVAGAVVHPVADGDQVVADDQRPPGVLDDRLRNFEPGPRPRSVSPGLGAASASLGVGRELLRRAPRPAW